MEFNELDFPASQEPPLPQAIPQEKAKEEAYYTAQFAPEGEDADSVFRRTADELINQGYSRSYENAKAAWAQEQDQETKVIVGELIQDPTIDKKTKVQLIDQYTQGGYINQDLRTKYAQSVAAIDNSDSLLERDAQEAHVDSIGTDLVTADIQRKEEDDTSFVETIGGEIASIIQIGAQTVGGTVALGYKTAEAISQYKKNGSVDWESIAMLAENYDEGFAKSVMNFDAGDIASVFGLEDELDESGIIEDSYITAGLGKAGTAFEWLAQKIADNNILGIDSKEQALFAIEALGFLVPAGFATRSAIRRFKHKPNSVIDVTTKGNPKKGGDMATEVITDTGDSVGNKVGTDKATVVKENMLPDADDGTPVTGVKPDINDRIQKSYHQMTPEERITMDTMFDDTIFNRHYRLSDYDRRMAVAKSAGLTQNLASSRYNMTGSLLEGKMVFTQGPDYAFSSKASVLEAANKLLPAIDKMRKGDVRIEKKIGVDSSKQSATNLVRIRDIKSNQLFTIAEFDKVNLGGRRKYQVEYNYQKKYDLLADQMLGESFDNKVISFFGKGKDFLSAVNRSVGGEYIFGTGFSAKWFEKARMDLAPRSAVLQKKVTYEFNKAVNDNYKLRKEISSVIKLQEGFEGSPAMDIVPVAKLKQNFPNLDDAQIQNLDKVQHAWRKSQDQLYEITNQGEKTRLIETGYNKGAFINGEFKGAIKQLKDESIPEADLVNLNVYDPATGKFTKFDHNPEVKGYVSKDGRRLVEIEGRKKGEYRNRETGESSDYMLVKESDIDILPQRVMPKITGHAHREYKSNFFVEMRPVAGTIKHNGKTVTDAATLDSFKETMGTASTKYEADLLSAQLAEEFAGKYEVLTPRNAKLDNIQDYTAQYRLNNDNHQNAIARNENMRSLAGDDVLVDPMHAINNAARRTVATATASTFNKAYEARFVNDFKAVLVDGKFPTSLNDISSVGKVGNAAKLAKLEAEAKSLWTRQTHFQANSVNAADRIFQNALHNVADIFEKAIKIPGVKTASIGARKLGDVGLTGVSSQAKRIASLAFITFNNPIRHYIIQPMMFYEQSLIFPKSFASTMQKTPIAVANLLHEGSPYLKADAPKLIGMIPKAKRAEFIKEINAMKAEGILDSIDQNLAVQEIMKGHIKKLEGADTIAGKLGEKLTNTFEGVKTAFNKYGFASGELTNRVGLWLQNKERWIADPKNKGKRWDDPRNIKEISFEAWKQSGAMTSAGALQFQRQPIMSFLTQFQSINLKGFMNMMQDNATNLTKADRAKLTATRIAIHGVEYGVPLGGGAYILDYLLSHEDPTVNQYAKELQEGVLDRALNAAIEAGTGQESNITLSQGSSINATNAAADVLAGVWNMARFVAGNRDVESPNIPSVKAATRVYEKIQKVGDMWKMNPVTPELIIDSFSTLAEITSAGNNAKKALYFLTLDDLTTNYGNSRGISFTAADAVFQTLGFPSRAAVQQYKQDELKRDIEVRIKEETENLDRIMRNILKDGPEQSEQFYKHMNVLISGLEQGGLYSSTEMDRIVNGLIAKDAKRFSENKTDSLLNYVMSTDSKSPDIQKLVSLFQDHPDPEVRAIALMLKGQMRTQPTDEEMK